MQLFVRGQALHAISVSSGTTSSDVKDIISVFEGIPTEEQLLTYAGIPLEDDAVVLNVVPEHGTISVTARIIGGKVHGSLTRAGKVRGQTPKVCMWCVCDVCVRCVCACVMCVRVCTHTSRTSIVQYSLYHFVYRSGRASGKEEEEDWSGQEATSLQPKIC
ncbi:hypothetical protein EMCRGX_G030828 [Ephydatia muelleri]